MLSLSGIREVVCKEGEGGGDITTLFGILYIQTQVEARSQEGSTCWVEIETGNVYDCILRHLAQVCCILVGVCEQSTCISHA